ncbi:hypothetical protein INT43_006814 [Umbelopsis isabellina]|uniref:Uncharacterized protein n=1 Tax=Mortierella isabellina TaxID=91625 RepID=A0A8H7UL51_MORIS|nr:hypothetical protein INT43_006814 [Umbelopsis isabellina]
MYRCKSLGLKCVYVVVNTPRDQEYLQLTKNMEAQNELKDIHQQIYEMEKEMTTLQQQYTNQKLDNNISPMTPVSDFDEKSSPQLFEKRHNSSGDEQSQRTTPDSFGDIASAQADDMQCIVHSEKYSNVPFNLIDEKTHGVGAQLYQLPDNETTLEQEWSLTLTKNGMKIQTYITNVQELARQIQGMATQLQQVDAPPLYNLPTVGLEGLSNSLILQFGKRAWMKILEGNRKALHRCVIFMQDQVLPDVNRIQLETPQISSDMITKLLQVYFSCQHLKDLAVHRAAFTEAYLQPNNIRAPVYAMCAYISTLRCKHVARLIPYESQLMYGEYYFSRARDMFSEQFDDVTLEAYCTLTFMAAYKLNLMRPSEGENYLSMAKRIGQTLLPEYSQLSGAPIDGLTMRTFHPNGQAEMFKRLVNTCNRLNFTLFLLKHPPKVPNAVHQEHMYKVAHAVKRPMADKFRLVHGGVHPRSLLLSYCANESRSELRYIQQSKYLALLREVIHNVMENFDTHFTGPIPSSYMTATFRAFEQNMRNWYYQTLPKELQLQLPLFDDTISDAALLDAVKIDHMQDSVPLMLLMGYYHEYMVITKRFLPRISQYNPKNVKMKIFQDEQDSPEYHSHKPARTPEKLERRRQKLRHIIEEFKLDWTEDELHDFYHLQLDLPQQYQIDAQDKCTRAANLVVRLLDQLTNSNFSCHFHLPTLMCAWDIHLRNSRLGHQEIHLPDGPVDPKVTRQARQNLIRCLAIMQRGYLYNTAERELWKHYQLMEQELMQELSKDPTFNVPLGPEPDFSAGHFR